MINNIVEIVLSTYDLSLNNEDRRNKFEIINNYEQNHFTLDDLKILLSSNSSQEIKIFGFKCLENFILYKWNSTDKHVAKSYLIEIIKEYGNFKLDVSAERVVRWILAKSVVYFIRHECPQNCDSIIEDLINLKVNGKMTKALILSIFFCLSETLPNDSQMPEKRKKEVISFVTERSVNIVHFCIEVIQEKLPNDNLEFINLRLEGIKLIQSLSSWIKYETLISMADTILSVVINHLVVDSSDYYLLEVLETMLDRKVKVDERYSVLLTIIRNNQVWQTFVANISTGLNVPINPYTDDKFRYLQKMFDLLLIIGNLVVVHWQHFVKDANPTIINDLMDLILAATHHPIKILSVEFLSFWSNGFKSTQESLRAILISKAQSLLPLLKSLSIKQNVRNPLNVDHEYLTRLIEESESESYISRIRMELCKTINVLTQYFTQDIVALTLEWTHCCVYNLKEKEDHEIECLKAMTHESAVLIELEACRFFTRCVMHSIFKPYSKTLKEVVQNMFVVCSQDLILRSNDIISTILSTKDSNVHISNIYLDFICILLPFSAKEESIIEACLEKILLWYGEILTMENLSHENGYLKQLQMDCGVWLLRIFRDYSFLIPTHMFQRILLYHRSTCSPIHSRPNIIEAMTVYICHSGNYSAEQQKTLLVPFIESIRSELCSEQLLRIFESGTSIIQHLLLDRPKPSNAQGPNYPTFDHVQFRNNLNQSIISLLAICRRLSADQNEIENGTVHTKSTDAVSIIPCPMTDSIMPMVPSLLIMTRSLNQIWSSQIIHQDFKSLMEISVHYRDSLIKQHTNTEKLPVNSGQSFGDTYVSDCRKFLSKLQDSVWVIMSKCCYNFDRHLYSMREWPLGVIEYVFADLGSMPSFKLISLIKMFLIPYVTCCPIDLVSDVMTPTVVPFIDFLFQKLGDQWVLAKDNMCSNDLDAEDDMEHGSSEDHKDLSNEIIEEQILRIVSKALINLLKLTMTAGSQSTDDSTRSLKGLGVISDTLCKPSASGSHPMILVLMHHICQAITWRDSYCCLKLCGLIQPFVREIHAHGLLNIDVIIFIVQQTIGAMNMFVNNSHTDIRLAILNLGVYLYEEYMSKDAMYMERFIKLFDKSGSKAIHTFQHKMLPNNSPKVKREALLNILQTYIEVPMSQMFSQEVSIRNLPPLLKPTWKSKNKQRLSMDSSEPLSLEHLFDE